jgi:SAM-dependent methyltransferase
MDNFDEFTYGERISGIYDELYSGYEERCIDLLRELAGSGPALELGIGTGRIALPLHQAGVEVHGIDASPEMLGKLRAKPDGEKIPVTVGNFAQVGVEGDYALIYIVFNTLFALLTQEEQVLCFQNSARHLRQEGVFLIEAFVPDMTRFTDRQTFRVISLEEDRVQLDANQIDPVRQQVTSQHVFLTEGGINFYPVKLRYAWPSELDLMARLAGLRLQERWGNWDRSEFSADSKRHISAYSKPFTPADAAGIPSSGSDDRR